MKLKQKIKTLLLGAAFLAFGVSFAVSNTSFAATTCGGVPTSIISCSQGGGKDAPINDSGVWGILLIAINILTAGVGIAAVGGIVYGSILYTSAGGSQEQIKKAIEIIRNVVIGIVAYALMYAGLNFLIPGGLFN